MIDKPQRVTIPQLTMTCGSDDKARADKDSLKHVPGLLWSEHEIMESANPVEIELKVDTTPLYRPRCPQKPGAGVHMSRSEGRGRHLCCLRHVTHATHHPRPMQCNISWMNVIIGSQILSNHHLGLDCSTDCRPVPGAHRQIRCPLKYS